MNEKKKAGKISFLAIGLVLVIVAALYFSGIGSLRSGVRLGWVEHKGTDSWSASYSYFNGFCEGKLSIDNSPDVLHVEIETEKGTIQLEIKDKDGNIIFSEQNIQTSSFEVEVPGNVTARITTDGHKGSFSIGW